MITFSNARVINPETGSEAMGSVTIKNGLIVDVEDQGGGRTIDCKGACLAPGIVDIGAKYASQESAIKKVFELRQQPQFQVELLALLQDQIHLHQLTAPKCLSFFSTEPQIQRM